MFVCFDALCPSQQFFSHAGMIPCPPRLNQYRRNRVPPVSLEPATIPLYHSATTRLKKVVLQCLLDVLLLSLTSLMLIATFVVC